MKKKWIKILDSNLLHPSPLRMPPSTHLNIFFFSPSSFFLSTLIPSHSPSISFPVPHSPFLSLPSSSLLSPSLCFYKSTSYQCFLTLFHALFPPFISHHPFFLSLLCFSLISFLPSHTSFLPSLLLLSPSLPPFL